MSKRLTLGEHLALRCSELGLTLTDAAKEIGAHRNAFLRWRDGTAKPAGRMHGRIEKFCGWAPGSVTAVLDGRSPTLLRRDLATVTPLHPGQVPPDDEFVAELRDMGLPAQVLDNLIAAYWAEKAGADVQRQERYRNFAREAGG